ncbi:MAG: class I SAM-dependent methyltransferase [Phycisphaerales bacterium]
MARRWFKERVKRLIARAMRPGLRPVEERLERIEVRLEASIGPGADKYAEELAYWRWLVKTDAGRDFLKGPFERVFGRWQRDRLRQMGEHLGLETDADLNEWCARQSAVEIGAGPCPALSAAPRWRRAVAIDPLARGYAEEGLLTPAAGHVTYLEATGERIPLPTGFADLVIIENALDHVSDPRAVVTEIRRLLRPGGLLWVLVDLSEYRDHMHPHPFNETRLRSLLAGFEVVHEKIADHHSHPKAYGEYRGLLRQPGGSQPTAPTIEVLSAQPVRC